MKDLSCIAAMLATFGLSSAAWSQPDARGAEASQRADEHFLKGRTLLTNGNIPGAYEEYKIAWSFKHTYDIAANLGNIELSLGKARDAAEHLAFSVRNYALTGTTPERLEKTKQLLVQARAQVTALTIHVSVDGAEVAVDGRVVGRSPIAEEVFVDPGTRTLEARLVTYASTRVTVNAEKGGSQQVELKLAGQVPLPASGWRPGPAVLVPVALLAAAGLAAGAGLTVAANGKASDASTQRAGLGGVTSKCVGGASGNCEALASDASAQLSLSRGAVAGFVLGAAFAVTAVGLGVWAGSKPSGPTTARLVWTVTGACVEGTW